MASPGQPTDGPHDTEAVDAARDFASTGIEGLDDILGGGLVRRRAHLVYGPPGAGKTTLALQFLLNGGHQGETGLYISLSETESEILGTARAHGWSLDRLHIFDASTIERLTSIDVQQTLFHHAEVELGETTRALLDIAQRLKPARVVFDPITELRLLAGDAFRYRRQIVALKQIFAELGSTLLLIEDKPRQEGQTSVGTLVHSIIRLDLMAVEFGPYRRRLHVEKVRSGEFREGLHDYVIQAGGMQVFPSLVAAESRRTASPHQVQSGVSGLDEMLCGGLDAGTTTLLIGPSGIGKTSIALHYVHAAARHDDSSLVFLFDERPGTLLARCRSLGIDLQPHIESGLVTLRQVSPAELTRGEFVNILRIAVERHGVKMVVLDSLTGYLGAVPGESYAMVKLYDLFAYLGQQGVTTLASYGQKGLFPPNLTTTELDVSYLTDTILLFRHYEHQGEVCQAISVFKRRGGEHERTIRDLRLGTDGIEVGAPLRAFRAVLSGQPVLADDAEQASSQ